MTKEDQPKKKRRVPRKRQPAPAKAPPPVPSVPAEPRPDKPKVRPAPYQYYDDCKQCQEYRRVGGPYHTGSSGCRCGSLASGGDIAHCTCSTCF